MPMVTQHDLADITDLEAGRKRIVEALPKGSPEDHDDRAGDQGVRRGPEGVPALQQQLRHERRRSWSSRSTSTSASRSTPKRGLVVPVIRDADKKSIRDLAAEVARAGREGPGRQAGDRRDARRHVHHHEPRRHRRHRVHADRQLPRGGDPRPVAVEPAAGGAATARSCRG